MDNNFGEIVDILEDIFGEPRHHNDHKGQIAFDCPVCSHDIKGFDEGDGKGNLEVNYMSGVFKCWVCAETHGTHGRILRLIKKYGNKKQLKNFLLYMPEEFKRAEKKVQPVMLPKEFIRLTDASDGLKMTHHYKQVMNYLKKRNITDMMIQIHDIGFCYEGEYAYRIIIPSYDENRVCNYFTGRSYLSKPRMKYKNPEIDKESLIWNETSIQWNETVYLVEGVFDSIFVPNSIPMLGKFITNKLYNAIYDNATKVVIVLDPDAREDQTALYHKLNCGRLMGKVYVVEIEGDKDIADLRGDLAAFRERKLD